MSTRALRSHDQLAQRRAPLSESSKTTNVKEEARIMVGEISDAKPLNLYKGLAKSTSASPARRVPKTVTTPAKRPTRPRKSLSPVPQLDIAPRSPAKRNLGSPMRRSLPVKSMQVVELSTSVSISSQALLQTSTNLSSTNDTSLKLTEAEGHSTNDSQRISPLKKAVRRPRNPASAAPTTTSPLKKPPVRSKAINPSTFQNVTDTLAESSPSNSIDELSLITPMKSSVKARSGENRRHVSASKPLSSRKLARPDSDNDELAAPIYTPIRCSYTAKCAQSPPTEENVMDDDDLWTPSIPFTLARSFSEMSLRDGDIIVPLKEPSHTFFDDEGEVINEKSLFVTKRHEQEAKSDHNTAGDAEIKVYVDCKSLDETTSAEYFSSILTELGAKTLCRWNWNPETQITPRKQPRVGLTHVVFFEGAARTLKKVKEARKLGIDVKCIGLSWVMQCKTSGRLTIGTDGHEVDVEAELIRMTHSQRRSMEPVSITTSITTPAKASAGTNALFPSEFLAPVDFGDETDNVLTRSPGKTLSAAQTSSTVVAKSSDKTVKLTDFEHKQLALARRNSAKFRPSISSPLSKKAWRA